MTKKGLNLRKVGTIVACLVVTMMFAACDKTNPDDDNGNTSTGKIDSELIGTWTLADYWTASSFTFKTNGTFEKGFAMDMSKGAFPKPQWDYNLTKGKCETKNSIAYFTSCQTTYESYTIIDMSTGQRATTPFSKETKKTDDFSFVYRISKDEKGKSYMLTAKVGEEIEDYGISNRYYKE